MRNNFFKKIIAIDFTNPNNLFNKESEVSTTPTMITQEKKKKSSGKVKKQNDEIQVSDVRWTQIIKIDSLTKVLNSILKYQGVFDSISKSNDTFFIPIDFVYFPYLNFWAKKKKHFTNSCFVGTKIKPTNIQGFFSNIREFSVDDKINENNTILMYTCDFAYQKLHIPRLENIQYHKQKTIIETSYDPNRKKKYNDEIKQAFDSYDDGKLKDHYQALSYDFEVSSLITLDTWLKIMSDFDPKEFEIQDSDFNREFSALKISKDYVQSLAFPILKNISWLSIVEFCNRLSISQGLEPCYVISNKCNEIALSTKHNFYGDNVAWKDFIPNYIHINLFASGYRLPTIVELAMLDSFLKNNDQDVSILEKNQTNKKLFYTKAHHFGNHYYDWSLFEFVNDFSVEREMDSLLKTGWFYPKELALKDRNTLYDFFYYHWDILDHPFINDINKKLRDEVKNAYFKEVQDSSSYIHDMLKLSYKSVKPNLISFTNKEKAYAIKQTNYDVLPYQRTHFFVDQANQKTNFFGNTMNINLSGTKRGFKISQKNDPSLRMGFRVVRTIR